MNLKNILQFPETRTEYCPLSFPESLCRLYLFSAFKESRVQALRDPLEHHFMLKTSHFLGQVGPGRASPHATCKALNRYCRLDPGKFISIMSFAAFSRSRILDILSACSGLMPLVDP